jgi:hypothetical protein
MNGGGGGGGGEGRGGGRAGQPENGRRAERHAGEISVASTPGVGTEFKVTVPAESAVAAGGIV